MEDIYLTVGQLKKRLKGLADDMPVFYQRIEDVYFKKHGWGSHSAMVPSGFPEEAKHKELDDEYIRVWDGFTGQARGSKKVLFLLTAHY